MDEISLEELREAAQGDPARRAADETLWSRVAGLYRLDPDFVQLNYGYYHPAMTPVLEAELGALRRGNAQGSQYKVTRSETLKEEARSAVAAVAGVDAEETALVRSSSEAINMVVRGLRLNRGDEIVASTLDYSALEQVLSQREREDGIVVRRVEIPENPEHEVTADTFAALCTERTRLIVVTHVIHVTGRVLPALEVCRWARERGIPVFVDAAHSFAQLDTAALTREADFFCASLHKWLGAPVGNGLLVVRRHRLPELVPLYGDVAHRADDIRRLERLGNRPDAPVEGLLEAVRWHGALTTALKGARLAYLHDRWAGAVRGPGIVLKSPGQGRRAAIGLVTVPGLAPGELAARLWNEERLYTVPMRAPWGEALRIVPGLPTTAAQIDRLAAAVNRAASVV
jgi:selenocysteine lyase/cysteine desulfurase